MKSIILDIETIPADTETLEALMPAEIAKPVMPEEIANPQEPDWQAKCPKYGGDETKRAAWITDAGRKWSRAAGEARDKWQQAALDNRARYVESAALHAESGHVKMIGLSVKGERTIYLWEPDREKVKIAEDEATRQEVALFAPFMLERQMFARFSKDFVSMMEDEPDIIGVEGDNPISYKRGSKSRVITYYGCLTPDHRILTADLRWIAAGDLGAGDELLSVEQFSNLAARRKWVPSKVEANIPLKRECVRVHLSDGTLLTATTDHPLLACESGNNGHYMWKACGSLRKGSKIRRLIPAWKEDRSYEAGWLAGFFDSEGSLAQGFYQGSYKEKGRHALNVVATQREGALLRQAEHFLQLLGFESSTLAYDPIAPHMRKLTILGDVRSKLRFLGMVRPTRLLEKFDPAKMNSVKNFGDLGFVSVEAVEKHGKAEIAGLQTSSRTYISEGFGSHNSTFDLPFLARRAAIYGEPLLMRFLRQHKRGRYLDSSRFVDLHEEWTLGDRETKTGGLSGLCKILGVECKTRDDGKTFYRWYSENPGEGIAYLIQDLRCTEGCTERMGFDA